MVRRGQSSASVPNAAARAITINCRSVLAGMMASTTSAPSLALTAVSDATSTQSASERSDPGVASQAPGVLSCLLDTRIIVFTELVGTMKRVIAGARRAPVLFLLLMCGDAVTIQVWRKVLVRTFSPARGYRDATHYWADEEGGVVISGAGGERKRGLVAILIGEVSSQVRLSHLQFLAAPPAVGSADFGEVMFYAELQFTRSDGIATGTIGVIWVPDLQCVGKPHLSDVNIHGALGLIQASMVFQRYHTLMERDLPWGALSLYTQAKEAVRTHLDGVVVMMDMRSHSRDKIPFHIRKMSGHVHVVCGTVLNGKFRDSYADQKWNIAPPCYRIRFCEHPCWVQFRSIDFWLHEEDSAEGCGKTADDSGDDVEASQRSSVALARAVAASGEGCGKTAEGGGDEVAASEALHSPLSSPEPECIVCLERPSMCVFAKCGHLGVCCQCRRWMLGEQYNRNKSKGNQLPLARLRWSKLEPVNVSCPICRGTTRILHRSEYFGVIFEV